MPLDNIFYWLLNMSIIAALCGVIIMLIRLFKKIPRRVVALLWVIPFLRMWIPVGVSGKYSFMSFIERFAVKSVVVYKPTDNIVLTEMNSVRWATTYAPIVYKINLIEDIMKIAAFVWLVIAAALVIVFAVLYVITLRELKDAGHLRDNIYLSHKVTSPAVYGVLRPRIILPLSYRDDCPEFVLLHEMTHIKRKDNLWRVVAFLTAALHWFNPLSWVFLKCFLADLELSCDERVLSKCGEEQKKAYALSLVECEERRRNIFVSAFGGAKIRTRIDNILSYKKLSLFASAVLAAFVIAISYILLTNA